MLALPEWAHELATALTLLLASVWLFVHFRRIARSSVSGCSGCAHGAAPEPARGRRSPLLRVIPPAAK